MSGAPDFSTPVLGFRVWCLADDGRLEPYSLGKSWLPGVNTAECCIEGSRHSPPVGDCGCGFYALHDDRDRRLERQHAKRAHALGAIAAWGEIEVHWAGFRARYACVLALAAPNGASGPHLERLRRAAERYRVPLVPRGRLRAAGRRYADWLPGLAPGDPGAEAAEAKREGRPQSPTTPLGAAAGATGATDEISAEERAGVWLQGHLLAERDPGELRLSLTPSLAALLPADASAVLVAAGSGLAEGEAIAALRCGDRELVIRTPVAGSLAATNLALGRSGGSTAAPTWIATVRSTEAAIDAAPIVWGPAGRQAYRCHLRALRDDAGLLDSLGLERHREWLAARSWRELSALIRSRPTPLPDHPLPDPEAIEQLAALLDGWIEADPSLARDLGRLGLEVRLRVLDRGRVLALGAAGEGRPRVEAAVADADAAAAGPTLSLDAAQLHALLLGELDLAPALGVEVGLRGSRTEVMVFASVFQRLFPAYRRHAASRALACQRGLAAA